MNAKQHLIVHAAELNKVIKAADIWIPDPLHPYGPPDEYTDDNPTHAILYPILDKVDEPLTAYDIFFHMIDITYDSGFAQGTVWFEDGSWSTLDEMNTGVDWVHYSAPELPEQITIANFVKK